MKEIRTLIVDDEELARKNLEFMLNDYFSDIQVVGEEANVREAKVL